MTKDASDLYLRIKYISGKYFICFILFFAFILRFNGIGFGLPYGHLPDEELLVNLAGHVLAAGDINPHWFGFPGSFIIYLLAALFAILLVPYFIYCLFHGYAHNLLEFKDLLKSDSALYMTLFYFGGRTLMAIVATITIYFVYLLAKKLFNKPAGLLAAFCLTISPLHITNSRIIRPDITAAMLIACSIYCLMLFVDQSAKSKFLITASLLAGFSIATKYTSGIVVLPILAYCSIVDLKQDRLLTSKFLFDFVKLKTNLSKALLFIFLGFFIFAPFVLLDFKHAIKDIIFEARGVHLGHERLPGIQNHIWYLRGVLINGIGGLFFSFFAALGMLLIIFKKSLKGYVFLIFPVFYYVVMVGFGRLRWFRWLIPILPFEAILFGVGFYGFYRYLVRRKVLRSFKPGVALLFLFALIYASTPVVSKDIKRGISLSRMTDARTMAKEWVEENLPSGAKIAYEYYGPPLHVNQKNDFVLMNMDWDKIVSRPISYYRDQGVDYIIITSEYKVRYFNEPDRYAKEVDRYKELEGKTELMKVFKDNRNSRPVIVIYKLAR